MENKTVVLKDGTEVEFNKKHSALIPPNGGVGYICNINVFETMVSDQEKIKAAIDIIVRYGGNDGEHHKNWVLDQAVRLLAGDDYSQIVAEVKAGEDGPETYSWDVGIAP